MNWKPFEPWLHRLMGLGAGIVNLRLLLDWRERKQLPPENDDNPVLYIEQEGENGLHKSSLYTAYSGLVYQPRFTKEYWSKVRVMDTLNDSLEYSEGQFVSWFVVLGAGIAIGWAIWG